MDLLKLTDKVESLLKGRALDGYEIMVGNSRTLSVEVKEGKVDTFKAAAPVGVGIRVLKGEGLGFSFSTSMEEGDLSRMIDSALVGAETQTPDPCNILPGPQSYPQIEGLVDSQLETIAEEQKIERALDLERLGRARRADLLQQPHRLRRAPRRRPPGLAARPAERADRVRPGHVGGLDGRAGVLQAARRPARRQGPPPRARPVGS